MVTISSLTRISRCMTQSAMNQRTKSGSPPHVSSSVRLSLAGMSGHRISTSRSKLFVIALGRVLFRSDSAFMYSAAAARHSTWQQGCRGGR